MLQAQKAIQNNLNTAEELGTQCLKVPKNVLKARQSSAFIYSHCLGGRGSQRQADLCNFEAGMFYIVETQNRTEH